MVPQVSRISRNLRQATPVPSQSADCRKARISISRSSLTQSRATVGYNNPMPLVRDMARPVLHEAPLHLHKTLRERALLQQQVARGLRPALETRRSKWTFTSPPNPAYCVPPWWADLHRACEKSGRTGISDQESCLAFRRASDGSQSPMQRVSATVRLALRRMPLHRPKAFRRAS